MNPKLRLILDFGPLAAFFLAYRLGGLMAATGTIIAATLLSLLLTYALEKKLAVMPLVSGVAVTLFGGMTLYLNDEYFIKIKPTLVNLLFAAILLGGLAFKKPMMKYLLESAIQMNHAGWNKLSLRWGLFFIFLAALNEIIWRNFSTDFWVSFKVFGMFTLTLLFTVSQLPMMLKHQTPEEK